MVRISTRRLRACLPLLANTNFNRTTWRTNHGHACASSLASAYAHTLSRSVSITLISVHSSFPGDGADDGVDPHSQTRPQQSAHGRGASYLVKPSAGRITGNSPMLSCGSSRPQQVPRERVMARLPRISPFFQGSDVLNAPFCRDFAIFGACPACATLPCPVRGGGTRLAGALKALFFLGTAAHRPSAVSAPSRRRSFDMDPQVFQLVEWRLQDRPVWRSGQSGASGA
ncbi:uncharacterized protein C8Q71DRAFT_146985 [Rhodofomes roseus]|uniref:Uncharacterized protein n=1 Tax=Rhodofomes roseus TaxID=34475 RepID=A0ABQ8KAL9_9APHY|nr:uncharacterized protein C8Q71DRAFT_146985 [Rhodofomes roseus]KAH9834548.1 hypothetical protein C8Q71DRAFT_146985 [Rhodofomes roseus]